MKTFGPPGLWFNAGLLLLGLLVLGVLIFYDPHTSSLFPPCPFYAVTGLYCPGCGSTRALYLLVHGDVLGALARNPLMVLAIPVLAVMVLRPKITRRPWVAWTAFGLLVSYGIVRNLPIQPFTLLAP